MRNADFIFGASGPRLRRMVHATTRARRIAKRVSGHSVHAAPRYRDLVQIATGRPDPINAALLVRPARACILTTRIGRLAWQTQMVAAIAATMRLWGAQGNAILPIPSTPHEEELFWAIASLLDADVYLHHHPSWAELSELAPDAYVAVLASAEQALRGIGAEASLAHQEMQRPVEPAELPDPLATQLVERIAPLHREGELIYQPFSASGEGIHPLSDATRLRPLPELVVEPKLSDNPDERLLLAGEFGALSPQLRQDLIGAGVEVKPRALPHRHERLRWLFGLGGPGWQGTPRTIGMQGLAWFAFGTSVEQTAAIVIGEDQWDFALAYALRCAGSLAWWLPPSYLDAGVDLATVHERFRSLPGRGVRVITTSTSDHAAAQQLAEDLTSPSRPAAAVRHLPWQDALPVRASRLLAHEPAGFPQPLYLQDGLTPRLNTPVPSLGEGTEDLELRWMTEVSVESGWPLARHPQLGARIADTFGGASAARTTADGVAYLGPRMMVRGGIPLALQTSRPRLEPLSLLEQLEVIADSAGWTCELSEKGQYCIATATLFGGFEQLAAALRREQLAELLMAYLDGSADAPGRALQDRRRYLSAADLQAVAKDDGGALLNQLTEQCVLTAGFLLKCPRCRYTAWYRPRETDPAFHCRRCRAEHQVDSASRIDHPEPVWHYQLDETVFQFLRHRGDLTLLAAQKGFSSSRVWPGIVPEVAFVDPRGAKNEIDFVIAAGGDLWMGEGFTEDRYAESAKRENERLRELVATAQLLNARGILLATAAEELRPVSKGRAQDAVPGPWPVLRIVSNCELLKRPAKLIDDQTQDLASSRR
jgi:hypothetical protein